MFDPIYGLNLNARQQKRNFQEDNPHYIPSFKKSRMWDDNLNNSGQNNLNVELADMHLIQNESTHLRVIDKSEYFPAVYVDMNHPFENSNLMDPSKFKYMPDLNAAQNPHYYEYNKLLFELYLERVKRSKSHYVYTSSSQHPL